jgi:hypothetical protein
MNQPIHQKLAVVFFRSFFLLFSQAVLSQDFSSIDTDLQTLENFYADSGSGDSGD